MKKNKKYLLLVFLVVFVFLSAGYAHALEITSYPNIPGLKSPQSCAGSDCLPTYIAYWFGLLVYIAGVLAVISFVVGAVQLISPSVEVHKSATDRMKGAVLGLVLTVSAFIILQTINPNLTTLTLTPLPGTQGVFWYNGTEKRPVGKQVEDVSQRGDDLIAGGFNKILYDCTGKGAGSGGTGPRLLFWEFKKPGLEAGNDIYSTTDVFVGPLNCGDSLTMSGWGSFYWETEVPGIYYCLNGCGGGSLCSGYMSHANTSSQNFIDSPFAGGIKALRIVNDANKGLFYGVVFHNSMNGLENGGFCNVPILNSSGGMNCFPVEKSDYTFAVDIFKLNKDPGTSGDGVTFYSEDHGWDAGRQAGSAEITDKDIPYPSEGGAFNYDNPRPALGGGISSDAFLPYEDKMCFNYNGANVNMPDDYKYKCDESKCHDEWSEESGTGCSSTACESFQDCPGSIRIKGNYLVGLYSDAIDPASGKKESYCQTFTENVPNLDAQPFLGPGAGKTDLKTVYIFATK